jgi:hypothetical protein
LSTTRIIGNTVTPAVLPNTYNSKGKGNFTINSGTGSTLNGMMPGGSTPNRINTTSMSLLAYTTSTIPKSNGKIVNVLITQTITLGVNINRKAALAGVIIEPGKYTTIVKSSTRCTIPTNCSGTGNTVTSSKMTNVSAAFATFINGKTVQYLYDLANDALGGAVLPTGVSYSDINNAIDFINKTFDGGALYLGNFTTQYTCPTTLQNVQSSVTIARTEEIPGAMSVSTYPNPYNGNVRFTVANPKAGQGSLEVFNMLGQKVSTVYRGFIAAGTQNYQLNLGNVHSTLIYRLQVGDKQVSGKLLHTKE